MNLMSNSHHFASSKINSLINFELIETIICTIKCETINTIRYSMNRIET